MRKHLISQNIFFLLFFLFTKVILSDIISKKLGDFKMNYKEKLSKELKHYRVEHNLFGYEMAEIAGVNKHNYQRWERCECYPNYKSYLRLKEIIPNLEYHISYSMNYDEQATMITEALREKGITQVNLSRLIGVSRVTVSQWCKGLSRPKKHCHLEKLEEVLGVKLNYEEE